MIKLPFVPIICMSAGHMIENALNRLIEQTCSVSLVIVYRGKCYEAQQITNKEAKTGQDLGWKVHDHANQYYV